MKQQRKLTFAVTLALTGFGVFLMGNAVASPALYGVTAQDHDRDRDWERSPVEYDEFSSKGYHDGIVGARRDYGNRRRPDVNNRDEFRHPHVPGRYREAYRRGFERGYQVGMEHLLNRR